MGENARPVDSLPVADLQAHPVWRFAGGTFVRPVRRVPVMSLTGKVVGLQVTLANGRNVWALLGNLDEGNARFTEHVLTLSVEREGRWFMLARYHDFDFAQRSPEALAEFLGLPIDEVFPITYDVRQYARGEDAALRGCIRKEPRERLPRADIIAMAVR